MEVSMTPFLPVIILQAGLSMAASSPQDRAAADMVQLQFERHYLEQFPEPEIVLSPLTTATVDETPPKHPARASLSDHSGLMPGIRYLRRGRLHP
jgi:hypothetical protein